ncbi:MAG: polysaccharide deacetylase family protein [Candidatus Binatia bacterium]
MLNRVLRYSLRLPRRGLSLAARQVLGTVTHVSTRASVVGLTFDDGPDPEYTPRLLEILHRHGARATFFMAGEAARQHPELVRQVAQAGHAIGNHGWDHPSFPFISRGERLAQMRNCAQAVKPYGVKLFRPPYGDQNLASRLDAFWLGYQVIMFSVATDDWCGADAVSIADQIERRVRPGSVVVLHDRLANALNEAYFDRAEMIQAVRILLERLGQRFRFVTVPELLRQGRAQKELWCKEGKPELLNQLRRRHGAERRYTQPPTRGWGASLCNLLIETSPR